VTTNQQLPSLDLEETTT